MRNLKVKKMKKCLRPINKKKLRQINNHKLKLISNKHQGWQLEQSLKESLTNWRGSKAYLLLQIQLPTLMLNNNDKILQLILMKLRL